MNLFSSTTADPAYSLFMSPRDAAYINDINVELLEIVSNQNFVYWAVEKDLSDVDDIYGESEKKVTRRGVKVYGWVMLDEPETITNNFTTEVRRRLEVYLHINRLTEIGIVPQKGSFIEWDNQFFEILEAFAPAFAHGLPNIKVGVTCRCLSARQDAFNPNKEEVYSEDIAASSQDPY